MSTPRGIRVRNYGLSEGAAGFLYEVAPQGEIEHLELSDEPCLTNRSHEPRLRGWCGSTNNCATTAMGLARVTTTEAHPDEDWDPTAAGWARVVRIARGSAEETAALAALGYPGLAESRSDYLAAVAEALETEAAESGDPTNLFAGS